MFVVSVLDNGEQRTFISEGLKILDRVVYATIGGARRQFSLAEILDIIPVDKDAAKEASDGPTAALMQ